MKKIPLITTGANGLVGSKFIELFADKYEIKSLELSHPTEPVDITDQQAVLSAFESSDAKTVIHLAAYTDVSQAWEQKGDKNGTAYQVNVVGTQNIIQACQEFDKYLIHVSTAYVFDGDKPEMYLETDEPNPIEWYGQTKWEAEQIVMASDIDWTVLRIDQPFRSDEFAKTDVVHRIIQGLQNNNLYPMFTNRFHGPTFIDDFALILDFFVDEKLQGLFHASAGEQWTDYEFAKLIQQIHQLPGEVKPGDLNEYLKTLDRPYQKNTAMSNEKLKKVLPFKLNSVQEAVKMVEV